MRVLHCGGDGVVVFRYMFMCMCMLYMFDGIWSDVFDDSAFDSSFGRDEIGVYGIVEWIIEEPDDYMRDGLHQAPKGPAKGRNILPLAVYFSNFIL